MGTNFYLMNGTHIGKRSAAGAFCWDCGETLCIGGIQKVHMDGEWYDKCPRCAKVVKPEFLEYSAAGRELGFNKSKPKNKHGVQSCCSFSWAIDPPILLESKRYKKVKDEYGKAYTVKEFEEVLEECPIRFYDNIGRDFF